MSKVDVLSFGETMAMWVAEETGDLAQVEHFHKRIAGADSNVAIGLARLGFNVAWLSRVGADSLGRFVRATLQAEGLNCQHVETDPQHPTGFQLKSRVDDGSDPQVEYFRRGSAASHLNRSAITAQLLSAGHLHATGIPPALSASCRELSFALMQSMRAAGRMAATPAFRWCCRCCAPGDCMVWTPWWSHTLTSITLVAHSACTVTCASVES